MAVVFEDFSVNVKAALDDAAISYLYSVASELEGQTKQNTSAVQYNGDPDVKNSWGHVVDESKLKATVGSPIEAAYWKEFGTGEYALHKDGRKGWWVYVEGNTVPKANQKYYNEDEAKAVAASMRADGLKAHATNGKKAERPLHRAFTSLHSWMVQEAERVFGSEMK